MKVQWQVKGVLDPVSHLAGQQYSPSRTLTFRDSGPIWIYLKRTGER